MKMCNGHNQSPKNQNSRKYLTVESYAKLVVSLCLSHLDYSNSILAGLLDCTIKQMQRIQNYGDKLVLGKIRYNSSRNILKDLHWLPIKSRIKFKILMLVYKCLRGNAPEYLRNLMTRCPQTIHTVRSNNIMDRLVIPKTLRKTFTSRSFSVMGPVLWNSLPNCVKDSGNIDIFKKRLKPFLITNNDF